MNEKDLFTTLTNYLISDEYIHCFLIILEYIAFIFPSCINASIKIKHFNSTQEQFQLLNLWMERVNVLNYYYYYLPEILHFVVLGFMLFVFICFIVISFIGLSKHHKAFIPQKILVIFIDIVMFRYFSILPLSYFANIIISLLFRNSFNFNILSAFLIIPFSFYIVLGLNYIKQQIVFVNISNPLLVGNPRNHYYPYDTLSVYYDLNIFFLKLMISLEYNYVNKALNINYIAITLNSIIIILSLLLFAQFSLRHFAFYFKVSFFYSNIKQNYLRNAISTFNCIISIYCLLFFDAINSVINLLLLLLISINVTIVIIYIEHNEVIKAVLQAQTLSYEMIFLMMINDIKMPSFIFNYKQMQNSVYTNHKKDCWKAQCPLRGIFSENYDKNTMAFYKYLNKSKGIQSPLKEITKLFYYKLHNKSFKFFRYYYSLISKYKVIDKKYLLQLKHLVDLLILKEDTNQYVFLNNIVENSLLDKSIEQLLQNMIDFFNSNIELKKPETVISLSFELRNVINKFKELIQQNKQTMNKIVLSNEEDSKAITSVLTYNIMIIQYVLENLINHSFSELPTFHIEQNEDYFDAHYITDNVLISSKDLLSVGTQDIQILKVTGELSRINTEHINYLSELFPHCIKQIGIDLFNDQLKLNDNQHKSFSFPIPFKSVSFNVEYTFGVIELLERNIFLTFGQYNKGKKSCAVLDLSDQTKIELLLFSNEILDVLKLRKKWIAYLHGKFIRFYMNDIFSQCEIQGENKQSIQCEFDAKFFLQNSHYIFDELIRNPEIKSNPLKQKKVNQTIENNSTGIKLTFNKIKQINDTIYLYYVNSKNNKKQAVNSLNDQSITKNNLNEALYESTMFNNFQSTTSMSQAVSGSSLDYGKSSSFSSKENSLDTLIKNKIKKEAKYLNIFSILMISLNILLIIICIIFLCLQIIQSEELAALNDFLFTFINIRNCMVGDFIALISSVCFAERPEFIGKCENGMNAFEKYFKELNNITVDINIVDYLEAEIIFKADRCLNTFSEFNGFVYSYNTKFSTLLQNTLDYYDFDDMDNNEIQFNKRTISLEEGVKNFLNTMFYLGHKNNHYTQVPIYFITYDKGIYSFKNIPKQELSLIQKEIYKGLFNFIYFYVLFNKIENDIKNVISSLNKTTNTLTCFFMLIIPFLNFILSFLCKQLLSKAYFLFKVLIYNIMTQYENNKEFASVLKTKLQAFISLVKLYQKNPNKLIKKIEKTKTAYIKQKRNKIDHHHIMLITPTENQSEKNYKTISFGNYFYFFIFKTLIVALVFIFIFFFCILLAFGIIILDILHKNLSISVYVTLQYDFENRLYNIYALSTLARIGNFTEENIAYVFEEQRHDGVFNYLLGYTSYEIKQISIYKSENPKLYNSLDNQVRYDCDYMFIDLNDSYLSDISTQLEFDYNKFATNVCSAFNILSLPNCQFLLNDLIVRNTFIVNQHVGNDYSSLYYSLNTIKFRELSLLYLFAFRPYYSYYRRFVIMPVIASNFNSYIILVSILLCVIIGLETLLFFIVKWLVINKILVIQNNLYLFNNCLE